MGSSGAAMNGLTVPARNPLSGDYGRRGVGPSVCPDCPERSVDCLPDVRGVSSLVFASSFTQPIIVELQMFDNSLQITHSRPEASALQDQTIVPIHSLTQQRLGHTNSEEILRTCEGRWTVIVDAFRAPAHLGHFQSLTGSAAGQREELVTFRRIRIVLV